MKKKVESNEMEVVRQRRYPHEILGMSNSIPRCTEYDLIPDPRGGECSFESPKPGNALWEEKNRP
jgi:hypothetical protein